MKKIVLGISGGISFVVFLILLFTANYLGGCQSSQTAAERWSSDGNASQVSCFFSVNSRITEDEIITFEHGIDKALTDASVLQESENPGARLWVDAYSADGTVTISSDKTSIQADAIGIGGDFFLLHPMQLLYGSYFSGNDLMQDYCVIDEDAAWQLFGSSDIAGKIVYIGGIPHMVTGVVERPSGRLEEAAGLDSTTVYVSYKTLTELGRSNGINHYEIVMPDPVTGFAKNYIQENLGMDEKNTEVLENTSRYSLVSRLKRILEFGTRSMNGKAIIYPYWENIARGYEDILTVITLFEILFLAYPVVLAVIFFCIWWKHKGWTIRQKVMKLLDKLSRKIENRRAEKKAKQPKREKLPEGEKKPKREKMPKAEKEPKRVKQPKAEKEPKREKPPKKEKEPKKAKLSGKEKRVRNKGQAESGSTEDELRIVNLEISGDSETNQ